jgi:hypothetical protein
LFVTELPQLWLILKDHALPMESRLNLETETGDPRFG